MKDLNEWVKKHKVNHDEIVQLLIYVLEIKSEDSVIVDGEKTSRYMDMLDDLYDLQ